MKFVLKHFVHKIVERFSKLNLIAVSIGIVYLWFGFLKFFPHVSPAEELAKNTIDQLTFGLIPSDISFYILAFWETTVGILLIAGIFRKFTIIVALVHMVFTFTPLVLFPEISFSDVPFSFTIIGQYIIKNIVIVSALLLLLKEHKMSYVLKS